jgi:hypothetical protein
MQQYIVDTDSYKVELLNHRYTFTSILTMSEVNKTYPAGKYYIGDICYALSSTVYELQWGEKHKYATGTFEATYKGVSDTFSVNSTCWGDGLYVDDVNDLEFCVDSGTIGIVPINLCNQKNIKDNKIECGHIIESTTPVEFHSQDGLFVIGYNGDRNVIIIDTACDDDDEDENSTASTDSE